jgi:hypothetical protein
MDDRAQLPTRSVGTIDGAAPTGVSPAGTRCTTSWNGWTWTTTMHARLDHDASIQTQDIRVTVTTPTSFGWTEEPAISGAVKC